MPWSHISAEQYRDQRGNLRVLNVERETGMSIKRVFWVSDVAPGETRGHHAHKSGHQVLICLSGSLEVTLRDHLGEETKVLSPNSPAIWMKPLTWGVQRFLQPETVLLVLASNEFDESDYIRDEQEFRSLVQKRS